MSVRLASKRHKPKKLAAFNRGGAMEFHEAANIFPLDEEHIDELAEDIREHGQQVSIETLDGKIIDGRRRWLACEKAGVEPKFRSVKPTDPIAYVLSLNLHRRHLEIGQRAMVGARAREMYDRQAKERQREGQERGRRTQKGMVENLPPTADSGKARDQVGKTIGVSGKTIDHATKVLKQGTPVLIAAVDADQIAVSTAARVASMSEAEQNAIAERAAENAKSGRRRPRPVEDDQQDEESDEGQTDPDTDPDARKSRGKGLAMAHQAINVLNSIPKNDALRKRGFQVVLEWVQRNLRNM